MRPNKSLTLTFVQKCKNILGSNWQGNLNTVKADTKGSTQEIHTSKVKYLVNKGKPYIWIPEKDLHNVNAIIDERASFAVSQPYPGPLANLLKLMKRLPSRVAMTGEIVPLGDKKIKSVTESLREMIMSEQKEIIESSYAVSGILSSSTFGNTSRSENLVHLLDDESYLVYKFNASSCIFIDGNGGNHEVDLDDFKASKADKLSSLAAKLIDGINQSEIRRRTLVIICFAFLNVNAKDAYILSVDCKGFDLLARVLSNSGEHQWKEFRITFEEEAENVELFCSKLVQMEEAALDKLKSSSGLG